MPELSSFSENSVFDHVLLSTVIFHLPTSETRKVLERTYDLLKENGLVFIGLRNGPSDPERPMFNIDKEWLISQAEGLFTVLDIEESEDDYKRSNVSWSRVILKKI